MIQLDRHSFGLQPETIYYFVDRRALGYLGLFTIYDDGQLKGSSFRVSRFAFLVSRFKCTPYQEPETRNEKRVFLRLCESNASTRLDRDLTEPL